jgi:hypothetical protein
MTGTHSCGGSGFGGGVLLSSPVVGLGVGCGAGAVVAGALGVAAGVVVGAGAVGMPVSSGAGKPLTGALASVEADGGGARLTPEVGVGLAPPMTAVDVTEPGLTDGTAWMVAAAFPVPVVAAPGRGSASALPPPPSTDSGVMRTKLSTPAARAIPLTANRTRRGRGLR